jgi:predicted Zn-dependent protease
MNGSNSTATINGNGGAVHVNGTDDTITASNEDIILSAGSSVQVVGEGDTVTGSGGYTFPGGSGGGGSGGGGFYGYYGFTGSRAKVDAALGSNIGAIAKYDLSQGDTAGAAAAEAGQQEAAEAAGLSSSSSYKKASVYEAAKWDHNVITWSLADSPGMLSAPFSGYLDGSYDAEVKEAFAAWAKASGLTFEEVPDSAQSDIRIGFGDFDTANSGVIGYTSFQAQDGEIQPDAIIRLEDPAQDALVAGRGGQETYAGTDAEFSQVLLHEIGHALGLADNSNPNSIMYYDLTSKNRTLDNTDIARTRTLYGSAQGANSSRSIAASLDQLVQAMASFAPTAAVGSNLPTANHPAAQALLLAAAH